MTMDVEDEIYTKNLFLCKTVDDDGSSDLLEAAFNFTINLTNLLLLQFSINQ